MKPVLESGVFVWGMGSNNYLGNSKKQDEHLPFFIKELKNQKCVQVATGTYYTLVRTENGEVFGWGVNTKNRFSPISQQSIQKPVKILPQIIVKFIAAGNWHSMIIDAHKNVYGIGHNKYGQLGLGHFENVTTYSKSKIEGCVKVACGNGYSLFLTEEKALYTAGMRDYHGHAIKEHISNPKQIKLEDSVQNIDAGFTHAACITEKGEVFTWGEGQFYQLGLGNKQDQKTPKKVEKLTGTRIVDISCSRGEKHSHTMACDAEGRVYTWGAGYKGKLGHQKVWTHQNQADEPYPRRLEWFIKQGIKIKKVQAGGIHSSSLTFDGYVYSFGCGSDGRIGHPESLDHTYLYREGFPRLIDSLKEFNVTNLASSYYHNSCIVEQRQEKQ